jgi:hypothetical protein
VSPALESLQHNPTGMKMNSTPSHTADDLYAVLGVSPTDTTGQIARAYRALLRRHHPDIRGDGPDDTAHDETLQRIFIAYAVLRDPQRRADYDRHRPGRHQATAAVPHHHDPPVVIGDLQPRSAALLFYPR